MYPAMNHQPGDLLFFINTIPKGLSFQHSETPRQVRRRNMSPSLLGKYRNAMEGQGWLRPHQIAAALKITRAEVTHAVSRILYPQMYVDRRKAGPRKAEYKWVE